jgi:DNA replication and repair protein RecF
MPAALASTGEQKAILVAIVLAAARLAIAERGRTPILLLDEIAAHLDADRREALYGEIEALGVQAWMTGADRSLFESMEGRAQFFTIRDARITHA